LLLWFYCYSQATRALHASSDYQARPQEIMTSDRGSGPEAQELLIEDAVADDTRKHPRLAEGRV